MSYQVYAIYALSHEGDRSVLIVAINDKQVAQSYFQAMPVIHDPFMVTYSDNETIPLSLPNN